MPNALYLSVLCQTVHVSIRRGAAAFAYLCASANKSSVMVLQETETTSCTMSALPADNSKPHQLCERHIDDISVRHRHQSIDDSRRCLPDTLHCRNSLPTGKLRLSSDRRSSLLSSFGFIPGHEIIETSVRFVGVIRVAKHCEFQMHVDTGKEQFVLQKRFMQFRDLRHQLLLNSKIAAGEDEKVRKRVCRNGACSQIAQQLASLKFPRRKMKFKLHQNDDINTAKARQAELWYFVEFLLTVYRKASKRQVRCCVNSQCGVLKAIQSFLCIGDSSVESFNWKAASDMTISDHEVPVLDCPLSPSSGVVASNALNEPSAQGYMPILRLKELSAIFECE